MEDGNSSILRYAFAAVFIAACLYNLQLGVRVAGVYIAGLSFYALFLGKMPLVDMAWNTSGYLSGAAMKIVSAICIFVSMIFVFYPGWVIASLAR
jgi:hypothetical protein